MCSHRRMQLIQGDDFLLRLVQDGEWDCLSQKLIDQDVVRTDADDCCCNLLRPELQVRVSLPAQCRCHNFESFLVKELAKAFLCKLMAGVLVLSQ